ncbi:MAG: hypothetical protein ACOYBW_05420 [Fluviibacter phosphoraccumulans]
MKAELLEILSFAPGCGSMHRIGLTPDGDEYLQHFSHASAMGSLFARYKYSQLFGKPLSQNVQRFHPVIIAKLCRYACEVGIDVDTLLEERSNP